MKPILTLCLVCLLVLAIPAAAQVTVKHLPMKYVSPTDGAKLYANLCASCHGDDLTGNTVVRDDVKRNINLKLASTRDPSKDYAQIEFGTLSDHQSVRMPSWKASLFALYGDDAQTKLAIYNLTNFINSKQNR